MKSSMVKSGVSTTFGAMTQAGLNAITNLEEAFDSNKTKLEISGQVMINKYKKFKGVTGRGSQVQHADVELLIFELVTRYIDDPDSFTEENIKDLSLILSKDGKYIVINKQKYERFLGERSDAATAGLLVSALTSSTIDLVASLLPEEQSLSREATLGVSSGLGVGGVLGSNLIVSVLTHYKNTSRAKRAEKIMRENIDSITAPRSIDEANENLAKLSRMLQNLCESNAELINSAMIQKAENNRIINKQPYASTFANVNEQRAQKKINSEITNNLNIDTSELDSNTAMMDNIFLKINENEKYISDHTSTFHKISNSMSMSSATDKVGKQVGDFGVKVNEALATNPLDVAKSFTGFFTKKAGSSIGNSKTRKIRKNKRHSRRKNKNKRHPKRRTRK